MGNLALFQSMLEVNESWIDYFIIGVYFVFVLGIGAVLRTKMQTSEDYFLSGRSLPSWITGLAFLGANLGALEIMGMAAGAAEYGIMQSHYYEDHRWDRADPVVVGLHDSVRCRPCAHPHDLQRPQVRTKEGEARDPARQRPPREEVVL